METVKTDVTRVWVSALPTFFEKSLPQTPSKTFLKGFLLEAVEVLLKKISFILDKKQTQQQHTVFALNL